MFDFTDRRITTIQAKRLKDSFGLSLGDGEWAIYRISAKGNVSVVSDGKRWPNLVCPGGLTTDGASHILVLDFQKGELYRLRLADATHEIVATEIGAYGLAWDRSGRLFVGINLAG